jgi:SAM-dependent methyltransferase
MSVPGHPDLAHELSIAGAAPRYHDWILDAFGAALAGDVAEVGAGTGVVSARIAERPAVRTLLAIEPFASMHGALATALANHPRAERFLGTLADYATAPDARHFDTLVYVNVLEHIDDDRAELRAIHAMLKPGGHALIFVPAWPQLMSPFDHALGHHRRYRRDELLNKIEAAGFAVEHARWFDSVGLLPWWLLMVKLKRHPSPNAAGWYDRLIVPWLSALERTIAPPIGKNLLVVARRD